MQPIFNGYDKNYGAALLCPSCGGYYLHHERVEIFERSEDADTGLHVAVTQGKVTTDNNLAGNPSGRRHGLSVYLSCEDCPAVSVLHISQHKGFTNVNLLETELSLTSSRNGFSFQNTVTDDAIKG